MTFLISWTGCKELFHLRNWYRFSALLITLREARFDESTLPSYFDLLDPSGNFAAFRAHMAAQPRLPFLLPYVKPYAVRGEESVVGEAFQFLLYIQRRFWLNLAPLRGNMGSCATCGRVPTVDRTRAWQAEAPCTTEPDRL